MPGVSTGDRNEHLTALNEKNSITDVIAYTKSQIHECTYCFGKSHKTRHVPRKEYMFPAEREKAGYQMGKEHGHGIR